MFFFQFQINCLVKSSREHHTTATVKKGKFQKRIYDLEPLEEYVFSVSARTPSGAGEPSEEYSFRPGNSFKLTPNCQLPRQ